MIDVIFSRRAQVPRGRDASLIPDEYRPRQLRALGADSDSHYDELDGHGFIDGPPINLNKLEDELNRNRLNEIATLVRSLTYGEMMELAEAIWNVRPEGRIDQSNLAMRLHLWSTSSPSERELSESPASGAEAAE